MEYDPNTHALQCPKCRHGMDEVTYGNLTIDRCTECQGIWFDTGEAEALKDRWMGEALDTGDPEIGKKWNQIEDVDCPRCSERMHKTSDPGQVHIWYEVCDKHGMFFDAGEFRDLSQLTISDVFKRLTTPERGT